MGGTFLVRPAWAHSCLSGLEGWGRTLCYRPLSHAFMSELAATKT
jgi:hypothetical protein